MKREFPSRCGLAFLLAVILGLVGSPVTPVHADGAFVVNTSGDTSSEDAYLSLREAMLVANGTLSGPFSDGEKTKLGGGCTWSGSTDNWWITGGCGAGFFDAITFSPTITQIVLSSQLPVLTDNGTFIDGNAGAPIINSASVNHDVFWIGGNDITISHLTIVNGYDAWGYADIHIDSGKDTRIAYNYLGTVPSTQNCTPTGVTRNAYYGVYVAPNSSGAAGTNNAVAYIYGNSIGCHVDAGVYVLGVDYVDVGVQPDGTTPDGNYIGISPTNYQDHHNGGDGVVFQANGTDGVRYGNISNNTIKLNQGNGIQLAGTGTNNAYSTFQNIVHNNDVWMNSLSGIRLTAGAYANLIGFAGKPNALFLNSQDGITVLNSNNNIIVSNEIGNTGSPGKGNNQVGVYLNAASGNWLESNLIGDNSWAGVWIQNSANNTLRSNRIGTEDTGNGVIPNGMDGIALTDGATNNMIGTSDSAHPEYRNLIKFNTLCGVRVRDGATNNTIDGNIIAGNHGAGVCLFSNSNNNLIGSSVSGVHQYILGNLCEGVYIDNSNGNQIPLSNEIGLALNGASPWGNGREGVLLVNAANSLVYPTDVAYNGLAGIAVTGNSATGNLLRPTSVHDNGGLPIDLGNDGATPNSAHLPPGPNNWLNYPVITSASGSPVLLTGTACANCWVDIYFARGNPAAPGGGSSYLQSVNANGVGNWSTTLPSGVGRLDIALKALNASNDTSEFSPRPVLFLPLITR
jgi:parallel beta-helix repeat protein